MSSLILPQGLSPMPVEKLPPVTQLPVIQCSESPVYPHPDFKYDLVCDKGPWDNMQYRRNFHMLSGGEYLFLSKGNKDLWAVCVCRCIDGVWHVAWPTDKRDFELLEYAVLYGANLEYLRSLVFWVYQNSGVNVQDVFFEQIRSVVWQNFGDCPAITRDFVCTCVHNALAHLYGAFVAENYYKARYEDTKRFIPDVNGKPLVRSKCGPMIKGNALITLFRDWNIEVAADEYRDKGSALMKELNARGMQLPAALRAAGVDFEKKVGFDTLDAVEDRIRLDWYTACQVNGWCYEYFEG